MLAIMCQDFFAFKGVSQLVLRVTEIFKKFHSSDDLNKRATNFMCKPPFQFRHQSLMSHNTVVECLALIGERCSAHDMTPLKEFLQQFPCQHAMETVEKYENEDKPDDIEPPFSLKCEKVLIVSKNGVKSEIVERLFPRSHVRERHIRGNTITCTFDCDSTLLIKEAYENMDVCKESLEELAIGFFKLWDKKTYDDVRCYKKLIIPFMHYRNRQCCSQRSRNIKAKVCGYNNTHLCIYIM